MQSPSSRVELSEANDIDPCGVPLKLFHKHTQLQWESREVPVLAGVIRGKVLGCQP
jgi:hypothetical protein